MEKLREAWRLFRWALAQGRFWFINGFMLAAIMAVGLFSGFGLWWTTFVVPVRAAQPGDDPPVPGVMDWVIFAGYIAFALVGFVLTVYKLSALFREQRAIAHHMGEGGAVPRIETTITDDVARRLSDPSGDSSAETVLGSAIQRLSDLAIGKLDLAWLQTVAIRLGILGTFFGLVSQLTAIRSILAGTDANSDGSRVAAAGRAVASLALAFNSSISGLLAALLLAWMALVVGARTRETRKELAAYVRKVRPRIARNPQPGAVDPTAAAEAIRAASAELREGGNQLAAAARELREEIRGETESLRALAAEQKKALASATQLAKQVETAESRLLGAFDASLARTATVQTNALAGVEQRMAAVATAIDRQHDSAARAMQDAGAQMAARLDDTLAPSLDRLAEALARYETPDASRPAGRDTFLRSATLAVLVLILLALAALVVMQLSGLSGGGGAP